MTPDAIQFQAGGFYWPQTVPVDQGFNLSFSFAILQNYNSGWGLSDGITFSFFTAPPTLPSSWCNGGKKQTRVS